MNTVNYGEIFLWYASYETLNTSSLGKRKNAFWKEMESTRNWVKNKHGYNCSSVAAHLWEGGILCLCTWGAQKWQSACSYIFLNRGWRYIYENTFRTFLHISIVTISHKGIIPIAVCKLFLDNFQLIYHIVWKSKRKSRIMQMERNTSTSNQLTFYLIFKKWPWDLIMFLEITKRRVSSLLKHFPAWKWRNFPQFFNIISTEKYFLVCWRDVMILPPRVWYG